MPNFKVHWNQVLGVVGSHSEVEIAFYWERELQKYSVSYPKWIDLICINSFQKFSYLTTIRIKNETTVISGDKMGKFRNTLVLSLNLFWNTFLSINILQASNECPFWSFCSFKINCQASKSCSATVLRELFHLTYDLNSTSKWLKKRTKKFYSHSVSLLLARPFYFWKS